MARGNHTRDADFDRDAEEQSEAPVVNVSPHVARFEIATVPGSKPRRYKLNPGQSVNLQHGYTVGFIGASRQPVRPTIESLTEIEVFARGPRLPMVVHHDKAREYRAKWEETMARGAAPAAPVKVMLPSADGGEPVEMTVQPSTTNAPRPAPAPMAPLEDIEDQDGPLDEPPPDHDDPEIVTAPTASESKGRKGR